jgi:chromosome segregation ATPase
MSEKPNLLLALIDDKSSTLVSRRDQLSAALGRIDKASEKLKDSLQEIATHECKLLVEVTEIESQLSTIEAQIAIEDQAINELTTQIELEHANVDEDVPSIEVCSHLTVFAIDQCSTLITAQLNYFSLLT